MAADPSALATHQVEHAVPVSPTVADAIVQVNVAPVDARRRAGSTAMRRRGAPAAGTTADTRSLHRPRAAVPRPPGAAWGC